MPLAGSDPISDHLLLPGICYGAAIRWLPKCARSPPRRSPGTRPGPAPHGSGRQATPSPRLRQAEAGRGPKADRRPVCRRAGPVPPPGPRPQQCGQDPAATSPPRPYVHCALRVTVTAHRRAGGGGRSCSPCRAGPGRHGWPRLGPVRIPRAAHRCRQRRLRRRHRQAARGLADRGHWSPPRRSCHPAGRWLPEQKCLSWPPPLISGYLTCDPVRRDERSGPEAGRGGGLRSANRCFSLEATGSPERARRDHCPPLARAGCAAAWRCPCCAARS